MGIQCVCLQHSAKVSVGELIRGYTQKEEEKEEVEALQFDKAGSSSEEAAVHCLFFFQLSVHRLPLWRSLCWSVSLSSLEFSLFALWHRPALALIQFGSGLVAALAFSQDLLHRRQTLVHKSNYKLLHTLFIFVIHKEYLTDSDSVGYCYWGFDFSVQTISSGCPYWNVWNRWNAEWQRWLLVTTTANTNNIINSMATGWHHSLHQPNQRTMSRLEWWGGNWRRFSQC